MCNLSSVSEQLIFSLHEDPQIHAHTEVNHPCGSHVLHYGDFVQVNSNVVDNIAGQLQSTLRVNKASAKAFEPNKVIVF